MKLVTPSEVEGSRLSFSARGESECRDSFIVHPTLRRSSPEGGGSLDRKGTTLRFVQNDIELVCHPERSFAEPRGLVLQSLSEEEANAEILHVRSE